MKGLILIEKGFEDAEALVTVDLLRRANIMIDLVSMDKELTVVSSHNIKVECDLKISSVNLNDYSFLVIPGGQAVFKYHLDSLKVKSIVDFFMEKQKLIASICAAPMILGKYGYLKNKNYTCFPGCESDMFEGIYKASNVEQNGNIITSKSAGTVFEFSYAIIKYLINEASAKKVIDSVYYQNSTNK